MTIVEMKLFSVGMKRIHSGAENFLLMSVLIKKINFFGLRAIGMDISIINQIMELSKTIGKS